MAKISVNNKYIRDSIENIQTNIIKVSEDKLRYKLQRQISYIKKGSGAFSYFSVCLTGIGVLVSNNFKKFINITPEQWEMIFYIITGVFGFLFIYTILNLIFHRVTVESIIKDIQTEDKVKISFGERIKNYLSEKNEEETKIEE